MSQWNIIVVKFCINSKVEPDSLGVLESNNTILATGHKVINHIIFNLLEASYLKKLKQITFIYSLLMIFLEIKKNCIYIKIESFK